MVKTFAEVLGVRFYTKYFDTWVQQYPTFASHAELGFSFYRQNYESFMVGLRRCIVATVVADVARYDKNLGIKLASAVPDLSRDEPWRITGVDTYSAVNLESILVAGVDTKKVAKQLSEIYLITPWRKPRETTTCTDKQTG